MTINFYDQVKFWHLEAMFLFIYCFFAAKGLDWFHVPLGRPDLTNMIDVCPTIKYRGIMVLSKEK